MVDGAKRLENLHQTPCAHQERVAAGKEYVGYVSVGRDVTDALGDIVDHLVVVVHKQSFAETIATVRTANLVAEQENCVGLLVLNARGDGDGGLVAGVQLAPVVKLLLARDNQLLDRIAGVRPVYQAQVLVIGPENILLGHPAELFPLRGRDIGNFVDRTRVLDAPHARVLLKLW